LKYYLILIFFISSCAGQPGSMQEQLTKGSGKKDIISLNNKEKRTGSNFPRKSYIYSFSKEPLTTKIINEKDVNIFRMNAGAGESLKSLYSLINIYSLSGKPAKRSLEMLERAAVLEVKDNLKNTVDDLAVADICLQALVEKKYRMVFFLLRHMMNSDNVLVQAKAYNITSLIAKSENRVPEAIANLEKSLSYSPTYLPAVMNLGFSYLKYGYVAQAKPKLEMFEDDWLVSSGRAVLERVSGNGAYTTKECKFLLKKNPNHKTTLFNCGINEIRTNKNKLAAKKLIGKALRIKGGDSDWDDQAYRMLEDL
jgi:tetratricopeptide (TPR) repeat protein